MNLILRCYFFFSPFKGSVEKMQQRRAVFASVEADANLIQSVKIQCFLDRPQRRSYFLSQG